MKKLTYRAIVLASMLIPVTGWGLESAFSLLPASLKSVYDSMVIWGGIRSLNPLLLLAMVLTLVLALASLYGLLRFRSWGPRISVYFAVISAVVSCFMGPSLLSGVAAAAGSAGNMLFGVALALAYWAPDVRAMFWPTEEALGTAKADLPASVAKTA